MIKNTNSHKIIVNYSSNGREDYNKGQLRLHESILKHWDGDYWLHSKERDGILPDSKLFKHHEHQEMKYFFKLTMIQSAMEQGYTEIYWIDSSIILHKDITGLANPILAFDNLGHPLYKYISDEAVANLNCITYLSEVKQIWTGAIGFDFNEPITKIIFSEWVRQAQMGSFNEGISTRDGFIAHRHDQAVLSVLLYDYKIHLLPYGKIVTSPHHLPPYEYGQDYYFIHKGIEI